MNWLNKKDEFEVVDVRQLNANFLPMILKRAKAVEVGSGLCIVQSFEPKPLHSALEDLGFEYSTDLAAEDEYRVYFYRSQVKTITNESGADMPFKPTAILNIKTIDDTLAATAVDFWEQIWDKKDAAIDLKTKLLLSLSNAMGAHRDRQATRELIKAYSIGLTVAEMDEMFSLFAWNQGIGTFASEIGPSPVFKAYKFIKKNEAAGKSVKEIMPLLMEKFGERNPEVKTL